MKNVVGFEYAGPSVRDATRLPAVVAAVATVVGLSLSVATPEVMAGTATARAVVASTIGGLPTGTPKLRFAVKTYGGFPVTGVTVALPRGLSFSTKAADLAHGVRVIGSDKSGTTVRNGQLTVTLHSAAESFVLTIAPSAMTESTSLEQATTKLVTFNRAHMHHERTLPIELALTLHSATGATIEVRDTIAFR